MRLQAGFGLYDSFPYLRICGQIQATANTTTTVPNPPTTVDRIAPVAMLFAIIGPNKCWVTPDSKPPSSLDVPMKRLFTADTRPRFSSGVSSCTSVCRTMTLTLSTKPLNASSPNATQNHTTSGPGQHRPAAHQPGPDVKGATVPRTLCEPDDHAGAGGAEHAGKLERTAVERYGARQFLAGDEGGPKRRAGRPQKRPRHADGDEQRVGEQLKRRDIPVQFDEGGGQCQSQARDTQHQRRAEDDTL